MVRGLLFTAIAVNFLCMFSALCVFAVKGLWRSRSVFVFLALSSSGCITVAVCGVLLFTQHPSFLSQPLQRGEISTLVCVMMMSLIWLNAAGAALRK